MLKLRNHYFILRHGQTIYQTKKKNFAYPWPEKPVVKLTKKGEKQIKKGAKLLLKEKVDLIFASDFFRTRQTAGIVAKELGLKFKTDSRLRDTNLGIFQGRPKREFYKSLPKSPKEKFCYVSPKGESWKDCQKRMVNFLKDIYKKYKGKNILIVSHGDPLWLLEGAIRKYSLKKLFEIRFKKKNCIKVGELRKLN